MSDIQVPVALGRPNSTAISTTGLTAGTLILNTDSVNTVWVSPESAMQPGYGIPIGPKGSVTWADGDKPCYAILDTASTATVTLLVTQTLTEVNDPVAIGAAVATELLLSGVPVNYISKLATLNTEITGNPLAQNAFVDVGLSNAASMVIVCSSPSNGARQCLKVEFHQASSVGGPFDTIPYTEYFSNIDRNTSMTIVLPANCGSARITNISPDGTTNLITYTSNRTVDRIRILGGTVLPRIVGYSGAMTVGQQVNCVKKDVISDSLFTTGPVTIGINSNAATGLTLLASYLSPFNGVQGIILGTFVGNTTFANISVPQVPFFLSLSNGGTAQPSNFFANAYVTPYTT